MSVAAKEMANPPPEIRRAKAALIAQAGLAIAYVIVAVNSGEKAPVTALLFLTTWSLHFVACLFVGLAAKRMGRRWWRYMSWQVGIPFGGPLMSLMQLQHWRDSRS